MKEPSDCRFITPARADVVRNAQRAIVDFILEGMLINILVSMKSLFFAVDYIIYTGHEMTWFSHDPSAPCTIMFEPNLRDANRKVYLPTAYTGSMTRNL